MPLPLLSAALFAIAAPPAQPVLPLPQAEAELLDHWDSTGTLEGAPSLRVARRDQPSLAWLRSSLERFPDGHAFPKGHPDRREAEAILSLATGGPLPTHLPRLIGSQFALWHWGRTQARQGSMPRRTEWEDLLLRPACHALVREAALRHALSFALAAGDEARLAALKAEYGTEAPEAFRPFLNAQGTLGGLVPLLRVWSLPDLAPVPVTDILRGARRIWIAPMPEGHIPPLSPEVLWLIPTRHGLAPANEDLLDDASRTEGTLIASRLQATGLKAALAPSRASLEMAGLVHFPILLDLDADGRVTRILMAEACLAAGHSPLTGPREESPR